MKPFTLTLLMCSIVSLAQAQQTLLQPGINLNANQSFTNDGSESLVTVTGQVRQLAEDSAQSTANEANLIPAAQVEIRFWQPSAPNVFFNAQTDEDGNYAIGLGEGVWVGEACGSSYGYYPAAWNLLVENKKLKSMQAVARKTIQLDFLYPSNLVNQHTSITLRGSGFGCNGSLVFTYSNSVDRCDKALPVEYQYEPVRVSTFNLRTDTELKFEMPELNSLRTVTRHIAFVRYEQGNNRSEPIPIGESILASQASNAVLCQGESPATQTSTNVVADVVLDSAPSELGSNSGSTGNPQLGGGYNPNGLTSNDFGSHSHFQAGALNALDFQIENMSVQEGF